MSATAIASSVGWAKWVPCETRAVTAATIAGCACPARDTPYPPWKSEYSQPSTSQIREPRPWLIHTGCGSAICQLDVAPPARWVARSRKARLFGWRATNASVSSAMTVSSRSLSTPAVVVIRGSSDSRSTG